MHHSYVNDEKFVWCRSTVAFINHSSMDPNHELAEGGTVDIGNKGGSWLAIKDINPGEEI